MLSFTPDWCDPTSLPTVKNSLLIVFFSIFKVTSLHSQNAFPQREEGSCSQLGQPQFEVDNPPFRFERWLHYCIFNSSIQNGLKVTRIIGLLSLSAISNKSFPSTSSPWFYKTCSKWSPKNVRHGEFGSISFCIQPVFLSMVGEDDGQCWRQPPLRQLLAAGGLQEEGKVPTKEIFRRKLVSFQNTLHTVNSIIKPPWFFHTNCHFTNCLKGPVAFKRPLIWWGNWRRSRARVER